MENDVRARSWFCVFNNPENHGFSGSPEEIAEQMKTFGLPTIRNELAPLLIVFPLMVYIIVMLSLKIQKLCVLQPFRSFFPVCTLR